jgi:hypothetical protein
VIYYFYENKPLMKITPLVLTVMIVSLFFLNGCEKDKDKFYFNATVNGISWKGINPHLSGAKEITADGENGDAISLKFKTYTPQTYTFRLWPATLIDFTVTPGSQEVLFQWQTSAETNTDHFEIERSTDGINWVFFHTEPAAGTPQTYQVAKSIVDFVPPGGSYYFRLKVVDNDGRVNYSPVMSVVIDYVAAYRPAGGDYLNGFDGSLEILSVDDTEGIISGRFHFKCQSASGTLYDITNGEFRVRY